MESIRRRMLKSEKQKAEASKTTDSQSSKSRQEATQRLPGASKSDIDFRSLKAQTENEISGRLRVTYQEPASVANKRLESLLSILKEQPKELFDLGGYRADEVSDHLGQIYWILGDWESAKHAYQNVFPHLRLEGHTLVGLQESLLYSSLMTAPAWVDHDIAGYNRIHQLVIYLVVLMETDQGLELAEAIAKVLPWTFPINQLIREKFLGLSIEILIRQSKLAEAANQMAIWALFPQNWSVVRQSVNLLRSALIATKQGNRTSLHPDFVRALVTPFTASCTLWDREYLEVLYHLGKALIDLNIRQAAAFILEECYLGCVHTYGLAHPHSRRVLAAIGACEISSARMSRMLYHTHPKLGREKRLSLAYEHMHLNKAIDLLQQAKAVRIDYHGFWDLIDQGIDMGCSSVSTKSNWITAHCHFKLGNIELAMKILQQHEKVSKPIDRVAIDLDLVKMSSDPLRSSKALLQRCQGQLHLPNHQYSAICRRLAAADLMHFPYDILMEHPPLISNKDSEMLSTGAYAVVDSVKVGSKTYARKSIALPRFHQKNIRQIIQNEISIMRALDHPHIVKLFLTYEEKQRFCIIMQPLADYDLEAFLEKYSQQPPSAEQVRMVNQWLICLCQTLWYLHDVEGIRHKDIKARNILIHGKDVVFADFGSSHAFLDLDNSTTDGPAFGHTKLYSAPEVLANGKRGRSADIFSLGCVFTELMVWLTGSPLEEWNKERVSGIEGVSGIGYSATLDFISRKFDNDKVVGGLYTTVVKPMLSENPKARPAAKQISVLLNKMYPHQKCQKCSIEMWMDDGRLTEALQSLNVGTKESQDREQ